MSESPNVTKHNSPAKTQIRRVTMNRSYTEKPEVKSFTVNH